MTPQGQYGQGLAVCPLCDRRRSVFAHLGRLIFDHHTLSAARRDERVCEASGWLVEDDEVIR